MFLRRILFVSLIAFVLLYIRHTWRNLPPASMLDRPEKHLIPATSDPGISFGLIDSIVKIAVDTMLVPGAVLSVYQDGIAIHERAFGYAKRYDFGKKLLAKPDTMTLDTRFDLASLTKVFATTFGIMLLTDAGKISPDMPVSKILPDFTDPSKDSITIRHLLTHSAGLTEWAPIYYHARNEDEARKYISTLPLKYPVGAGRHYSDLGFMLLGYIIEKVSNEDLNSFLQEELYSKLDLQNTSFNPNTDGPPFACTSHGNPFEKKMVYDDHFGFKCDEDPTSFQEWRHYVLCGEVNDGNSYYAHQGMAGHAGLFSTAHELQILLGLLLNKGVYQSKRYIKEETINLFLTKDRFGHGLGWAMSPSAVPVDNLPPGSFGHTGFTGTFAVGIPKYNLGLILLTNRQNLDVNADGNYNSVTKLRKDVTENLIRMLE